jgi:hypothetical protein
MSCDGTPQDWDGNTIDNEVISDKKDHNNSFRVRETANESN